MFIISRKTVMYALLLVALSPVASEQARAAMVYTYSFAGEIALVFDDDNILPADIFEGASYTGQFSYVDSAYDIASSNTIVGRYQFDSSKVASLSAQVGSNTIARSSADDFLDEILILDRREFDMVLGDNQAMEYVPLPSDPALSTRSISFNLRRNSSSGPAPSIPSKQLSDITSLNLADFDDNPFWVAILVDTADPSKASRFDGRITELELVSAVEIPEIPLPAALPLFSSALCTSNSLRPGLIYFIASAKPVAVMSTGLLTVMDVGPLTLPLLAVGILLMWLAYQSKTKK